MHLLTASVGVVRGVGSNSQQQPFDLCGQLTMDVGQNVLWLPVWKRGRHLEPPTLCSMEERSDLLVRPQPGRLAWLEIKLPRTRSSLVEANTSLCQAAPSSCVGLIGFLSGRRVHNILLCSSGAIRLSLRSSPAEAKYTTTVTTFTVNGSGNILITFAFTSD